MSRFPPIRKLTKWVKFAFSSFQKPPNFVKIGKWVDFHQAGNSQNEQSLLSQAFWALELSKAPSFVKICKLVDFHQRGSSKNKQSLLFHAPKGVPRLKMASEVAGYDLVLIERSIRHRSQWIPFFIYKFEYAETILKSISF